MQDYKDFTFDKENFSKSDVKRFADDLHNEGQHFVMIVDPAIKIEPGYDAYDQGIDGDVFIKDPNNQKSPLIGKVWPGLTNFPDFFKPAAKSYWKKFIQYFVKDSGIDGLWIDMNEPASFCDGDCSKPVNYNTFNYPPYRINNDGSFKSHQLISKNTNNIFTGTLPMDALYHNSYIEYNVHNLYGLTEAISTYNALDSINNNQKRFFILSRSTFPSIGKYVGHWTGDNFSTWTQMADSIQQMINYQIYGIPFVGSDICGFINDTTEELCSRWMALGTFYPFSRNHNGLGYISQEPYVWKSVGDISKKYIGMRNSLISYWYTLAYEASIFLKPIINSLFFTFPTDPTTYNIFKQFMIGESLLITPVLEKGKKTVWGYIPKGLWYSWDDWELIDSKGSWHELNAPLSIIPVHIRSGKILTIHEKHEMTISQTVLTPFTLIIALERELTKDKVVRFNSSGNLFIDDGETKIESNELSYIELVASGYQSKIGESSLTVNSTGVYNYNGPESKTTLSNVKILFPDIFKPSIITLDGKIVYRSGVEGEISWEYIRSMSDKILGIQVRGLNIKIGQNPFNLNIRGYNK